MIDINFCDDTFCEESFGNLSQWDTGQYLRICGLNINCGVKVQFSLQNYEGSAVEVESTIEDGFVIAKIPQFILENPDVTGAYYNGYVFICESESGSCCKTTRKVKLIIRTRPKPEDYVFTDDEIKTFDQLAEDLRKHIDEEIEVALGNIEIEGVVVDKELSEESKNAVENRVIAKEVNSLKQKDESLDKEVIALRERNAELEETVEKLQIKTTTEPSPFHHITDSANMKVVDFGMEGKTEQETTSGKNFWNKGDIEITDSSGYTNQIYISLPAGTYTFSALVDSTDTDSTYCMTDFGNIKRGVTTRTSVTKTLNADIAYLRLYASNNSANSVGDTATFKDIQIEAGSTATDYEPYTNGPSPNPDYPQEIVNAGVYNEETGRYEHKCCVGNKNLIVNEATSTNIYGVDFSVNADGSIAIKGTNIYVHSGAYFHINKKMFLKAGTYVLESGSDNIRLALHKLGTSGYYYSDSHTSKNIILTEDAYWETYIIVGGGATVDDIAYPMLRFKSDDSAFAPLVSKPFTLTSPVPITKWDKLVKRDGIWGWSVNLYKLIIDGNGKWSVFAADKGFVESSNKLLDNSNIREGYCNQMRVGNSVNDNTVALGYGNKYLYVGKVSFYDDTLPDSGLANWKAYLNENPLEIVTYADEEQAFHPLPDEEQTLLNNLETYYGVTNVYNEQGCPMWLTYVNDTKLYVDNQIKNAVATTQALILEN